MPGRFRVLACVVLMVQGGVTWAQVGASNAPALGGLLQTNPFDADRKLWPDRTPPPPPPPVPAPVTDADLEVYGVVMAGGAQKALLKLGKRFEGVSVGPSGMAVVPVGGQLGEFVLSQLKPDQILLKAPGGEQWIRFSIKKDRAGAPVTNQAVATAVPGTFVPAGQPALGGGGVSPFSGTPIGAVAVSGGAAGSGAPLAPDAAAASQVVQPGSLAAAIFAAQAAQKASTEGSAPVPLAPGVNPFEALFQQQKK